MLLGTGLLPWSGQPGNPAWVKLLYSFSIAKPHLPHHPAASWGWGGKSRVGAGQSWHQRSPRACKEAPVLLARVAGVYCFMIPASAADFGGQPQGEHIPRKRCHGSEARSSRGSVLCSDARHVRPLPGRRGLSAPCFALGAAPGALLPEPNSAFRWKPSMQRLVHQSRC